MDQISIFGVENEAVNSKKEKEKVPAKKFFDAQDKKIPDGRPLLVCYAGYKVEVTIEEREKNKSIAKDLGKDELEVVRQKMEHDFPELSESRVTWHWEDEDKEKELNKTGEAPEGNTDNGVPNIKPVVVVPVVTAGKKG